MVALEVGVGSLHCVSIEDVAHALIAVLQEALSSSGERTAVRISHERLDIVDAVVEVHASLGVAALDVLHADGSVSLIEAVVGSLGPAEALHMVAAYQRSERYGSSLVLAVHELHNLTREVGGVGVDGHIELTGIAVATEQNLVSHLVDRTLDVAKSLDFGSQVSASDVVLREVVVVHIVQIGELEVGRCLTIESSEDGGVESERSGDVAEYGVVNILYDDAGHMQLHSLLDLVDAVRVSQNVVLDGSQSLVQRVDAVVELVVSSSIGLDDLIDTEVEHLVRVLKSSHSAVKILVGQSLCSCPEVVQAVLQLRTGHVAVEVNFVESVAERVDTDAVALSQSLGKGSVAISLLQAVAPDVHGLLEHSDTADDARLVVCSCMRQGLQRVDLSPESRVVIRSVRGNNYTGLILKRSQSVEHILESSGIDTIERSEVGLSLLQSVSDGHERPGVTLIVGDSSQNSVQRVDASTDPREVAVARLHSANRVVSPLQAVASGLKCELHCVDFTLQRSDFDINIVLEALVGITELAQEVGIIFLLIVLTRNKCTRGGKH